MTYNYHLIYYKNRNAKYFSLFIAKITITKGYHQRLFREKKKERINKSFREKKN